MRAILTILTAILLLLPAPAHAQSVLRIGLNDDPDALDPTISRAYTGRLVFAALCDKLFDVTPDLKIVPQLATGYEWSADRKAIVIKLRPGVRFQFIPMDPPRSWRGRTPDGGKPRWRACDLPAAP